MFGEKYPDPVRVVSIGVSVEDLVSDPESEKWANFAIEFCGGTHLKETKPIQLFYITSEEGIAKGTRRIVALTGLAAIEACKRADEFEMRLQKISTEAETLAVIEEEQKHQLLLQQVSAMLSAIIQEINAAEIPASRKIAFRERIEKLQKTLRKGAKREEGELERRSGAFAEAAIQTLTSTPSPHFVGTLEVGGHSVLLSDTVKKISEKAPETAVMLFSTDTQKKKILIVSHVPKSLVGSLQANVWVTDAAKVCGGKGGGKAELAQGSGTQLDKLHEAVLKATMFAREKLGK